MNLNPALGGIDRIGSFVMGAGLLGVAILGGVEETWLRALGGGLGIVFAIGGIGGT